MMTPHLPIPPHALVLEIGSGHRPHPRADVLSDKYVQSNRERGGDLVTDRPFIELDAQQLPFRPNVFDYIICRHVLEHLPEPERFFHEVGRVGKAGYIETPSLIWEHLFPQRDYHRWLLLQLDDEILLVAKPKALEQSVIGRLFGRVNGQNAAFRLFERQYADLLYVRHFWENAVRFTIEPNDERRRWFDTPWTTQQANQFIPSHTRSTQAIQLLGGTLGSLLSPLRARWKGWRDARQRVQQVDLLSLLQCPSCRGETFVHETQSVRCLTCDWKTTCLIPR